MKVATLLSHFICTPYHLGFVLQWNRVKSRIFGKHFWYRFFFFFIIFEQKNPTFGQIIGVPIILQLAFKCILINRCNLPLGQYENVENKDLIKCKMHISACREETNGVWKKSFILKVLHSQFHFLPFYICADVLSAIAVTMAVTMTFWL